MYKDNIDSIFAKRLGGSYNIRGISYQIRYSVLRALELYSAEFQSITLEGIEDLDLKGFSFDNNTFIQVKTSENPWKWYQLKSPVINFFEVYKTNVKANFTLVLNSSFKGDIEKLSQYVNLDDKNKKEIEKKFIVLCKKELDDQDETFINFLNNISIISLDDEELMKMLFQKVDENFDVKTKASEIYVSILVSKFLDWAKERKTITKSDISNIVLEAKEQIAIEQGFQAIGNGLISKVNWDTNNYVDDFYEGKNTQPSHIASGADVKRMKWLDIIHQAVLKTKVCVIKSSSGQGKSTLLYRYAYDYWIKDNIYRLTALSSVEHVTILMEFLKYRAKLGLPVLVLIDSIDFKVQYWSELIKLCAGFEIHFLAGVRKEDWFRYGKENLKLEVIEPFLDLTEAREIYSLLKKQGKINQIIRSPEIAFEKIGDNKLLIEYVYLITQGEMLAVRLKDQIKVIDASNEDPVKIEILRKVSLASVFSAPLNVNKLKSTLSFRNDSQKVFESLEGEYLRIENELLYGLHWVRTEHLYRILFTNHNEPLRIALEIIEAIPEDYIKGFIADLLIENTLGKSVLIDGLLEKRNKFSLSIITEVIEGFYIAGEKNFYLTNKNIFDEANAFLGHKGLFLLLMDLSVIQSKENTLDKLIEILGSEQNGNYIKIKEFYSQINNSERGRNFCEDFFKKFISDIDIKTRDKDYFSIARLLDWLCFCNIALSSIPDYKELVLQKLNDFQSLSIESFTLLTQALYRYDEKTLLDWYNAHSKNIVGYLKYLTDCVYLNIESDIITFKFIPSSNGKENAHEQTIKRYNIFREALPFITTFNSEGLYYVPFKPTNDETVKNITPKDFYFLSDVKRNQLLQNIINENYFIESYYEYQEHLHKLRTDIIKFFREFCSILIKLLKHIPHNSKGNFENGVLFERILDSIRKFPDPPPQTNEFMKKEIKDAINDWSFGVKNFIWQIDNYIADSSKQELLNLALFNLRNSTEKLPGMHIAVEKLLSISPDYFPLETSSSDELKLYQDFYDLLELNYKIRPIQPISKPIEYIHTKKDKEINIKIQTIQDQFTDIQNNYIFSDTIVSREGSEFYSIMFEIDEVANMFSNFVYLLERLSPVKQVVNFFFLIPIISKKRIDDKHFFISSTNIEKIELNEDVGWEHLMPTNWGSELIKGVPEYPIESIHTETKKSLLEGCKLNFQCLENYQSLVSNYLDETDEYDKKLFEIHKTKIKEMFDEATITIVRLKEKVSSSANYEDLVYLEEILGEPNKGDILDVDFQKCSSNLNKLILE